MYTGHNWWHLEKVTDLGFDNLTIYQTINWICYTSEYGCLHVRFPTCLNHVVTTGNHLIVLEESSICNTLTDPNLLIILLLGLMFYAGNFEGEGWWNLSTFKGFESTRSHYQGTGRTTLSDSSSCRVRCINCVCSREPAQGSIDWSRSPMQWALKSGPKGMLADSSSFCFRVSFCGHSLVHWSFVPQHSLLELHFC
jgi:hypothetical protein